MEEVRVLDKDSHDTRKGWLPWTSKVSQGLLALDEGIGGLQGLLALDKREWGSQGLLALNEGVEARKGC